MALSRSITSLIADEQGMILKDFLGTSTKDWAVTHMQLRYGAAPPLASDPADHPARLCYQHLLTEYDSLRKWFDNEGKLSPLIMSRYLSRNQVGPIRDGIGWDFQMNGDPEPRMLQFKGTLIACRRSAELKPVGQKLDCGSAEMGSLAKLVRSAYAARAEVHTWGTLSEGKGDDKRMVPGADLSRRWVAWRTYNFLIRFGAEDDWAWQIAKCRDVFGEVDCAQNLLGDS